MASSVVHRRASRLVALLAAAGLVGGCGAPGVPVGGAGHGDAGSSTSSATSMPTTAPTTTTTTASPTVTTGTTAPTEPTTTTAPPGAPRELSGTLPSGTTWRVVVPASWNGTLLLYGRGYLPSVVPGPPPAQVAPDATTQQALLDRGYALAGSSYESTGWPLATAARDQLDALDAAAGALDAAAGRRPGRVLAWGTSMGGLITAQLAERGGAVIDGALPTCGIVGGGVALLDYQLDAAHAIDQLLAPDAEIDLVGYATPAEATAASSELTAAVEAAQQTPQGRARVALAAALLHLPHWLPDTEPPAVGDFEARQEAQHAWLRETLSFIALGRHDIETAAGGNASSNGRVDYRHLFHASADRRQVATLYRAAGLDLRADLDQLTRTAATAADPAARRRLRETSTVSGELAMPVLSLHTISDNLVPVQHEQDYRVAARRAGSRPLLRQAYVARPGHCSFTSAELVASLEALDRRVERGRWGHAATAVHLDDAAEGLGLGESAIVDIRPGALLADR